jgi:hypothetical protein
MLHEKPQVGFLYVLRNKQVVWQGPDTDKPEAVKQFILAIQIEGETTGVPDGAALAFTTFHPTHKEYPLPATGCLRPKVEVRVGDVAENDDIMAILYGIDMDEFFALREDLRAVGYDEPFYSTEPPTSDMLTEGRWSPPKILH